jgi:hypothetical protein
VADARRRFNLFFYDVADPDCGVTPAKSYGFVFDQLWDREEGKVRAMARKHASRLEQTRAAGIALPMDQLVREHQLDELDRRIIEALLVHSTGLNCGGGAYGFSCGRIARSAADWNGDIAQSCLPRMLPESRLAKSGLVVFRRNSSALDGWMVELAEDTLLRLVRSTQQPAVSGPTRQPLRGDILAYLDDAGVVLSGTAAAGIRTLWGHLAYRDLVDSSWGFGKLANVPTGCSVLFHGPSGTGKTITAKHIGTALGQDLQIVTATDVVDKYVGETQKKLRGVFKEAEHKGAALIFDEADALFGRRGDVARANDRLFNSEINSALVDLEQFAGVCFLTTNHVDLLDPAVLRRIRHKVFFGVPTATVRERIWRRHVPKEAPIAADVDFAGLGRDYVLTGGQIVNAVLAALAAAAARIAESGVEPVVAMSDFTTAAGRERDSNPATKLKSIGF